VPRDGRLIALILASKGIADADERVIHQMLDFAHRMLQETALTVGYTADVLVEAQLLADHAGRNAKIEKEDVELAIQTRKRHEFAEGPPREVSIQVDRANLTPVPVCSGT
jgi:transcription initiation factor TFIID subunit 9B